MSMKPIMVSKGLSQGRLVFMVLCLDSLSIRRDCLRMERSCKQTETGLGSL